MDADWAVTLDKSTMAVNMRIFFEVATQFNPEANSGLDSG